MMSYSFARQACLSLFLCRLPVGKGHLGEQYKVQGVRVDKLLGVKMQLTLKDACLSCRKPSI